MIEIYRTLFKKEIVAEFAKPTKKSDKALIICPGMPGSPSKKDMIELFCKKGFWVFSIRYRGSWESYGKFLKKSPHLDILDVVDELNFKFIDLWSNKKFYIKNPKIYLIGASFGGPAAILASKNKKIRRVLAFSPVIDWRVRNKGEPLDKLKKFIKIAFGGAYRFSNKDWNKLGGDFYNLITNYKGIDGKKIWIFHAKDDDIVNYKPSEKFAKLINCRLTLLNKGGHKIRERILNNKRLFKNIIRFLN